MPAVLKPFATQTTRRRVFAIMTSGMSAVAGSLLAGMRAWACVLDIYRGVIHGGCPGGLLFAKLMCHHAPEPEQRHLR